MAKSEEDIRQDIIDITRGTSYNKWQIGITNDPERRLPERGKSPDYAYIARANTIGVARRIEKDFLDKGMQGGPGGGTPDSTYIYLFKKKR
jgi:hypothetical protein